MVRIGVTVAAIASVVCLGETVASATDATVTIRYLTAPLSALSPLLPRDSAGDDDAVFALSVERIIETTKRGIRTTSSTILVKGSRMRIDGMDDRDDPETYVIVDTKRGTTDIVMPGKKRIVHTTPEEGRKLASQAEAMQEAIAEQMRAVQEQMKGMGLSTEQMAAMPGFLRPHQDTPRPTIRDLGKTATINGAKAHAWEIRQGSNVTRAWMTNEHRKVASAYRAFAKQRHDMTAAFDAEPDASELLEEHGLVWRLQEIDKPAAGAATYEITDVLGVVYGTIANEKMTVPTVADGYQVTSPSDMMQQAMPPDTGAIGLGQPPR